MTQIDRTINYIELPLSDTDRTKKFYSSVFGWEFQDWGPDYISFSGAAVDGGFSVERKANETGVGSLVVLFADDLDATFERVKTGGARIAREIFEFPGGRRFHFIDPNGNELAIWGNLPE